MKSLIAALALSTALIIPAAAWDQWPPRAVAACQAQAPYGFPQIEKLGAAICRHAYVTLNDIEAKIPVWTSYVLTPSNAIGCLPRSNAFMADNSLPKGKRAEVKDYAGSGYDIGHVAPDGDMSFDQQAEYESFLMTNMYPQLPGLNRGIWKLLETAVRGWAVQRNHAMVVYVGAIRSPNEKTIGDSRVVVPNYFFKIVIDTVTNEAAGFLFEHRGAQGNDLTKVRAPIAQIEQASGIKFGYPAGVKEMPGNVNWPVDYGALTKAKRAKCGATAE